MVDLAYLNTTTLEAVASFQNTVTHYHNLAKNIETAHFGNLYTNVCDGLDYYVVEKAAKPLLSKAPEWIFDNKGVSTILDNKGLAILAGGMISFILFVIWLHPKGEPIEPPKPIGEDEKGVDPLASNEKARNGGTGSAHHSPEPSGEEGAGEKGEADPLASNKKARNESTGSAHPIPEHSAAEGNGKVREGDAAANHNNNHVPTPTTSATSTNPTSPQSGDRLDSGKADTTRMSSEKSEGTDDGAAEKVGNSDTNGKSNIAKSANHKDDDHAGMSGSGVDEKKDRKEVDEESLGDSFHNGSTDDEGDDVQVGSSNPTATGTEQASGKEKS
jgi:hypothetical protein